MSKKSENRSKLQKTTALIFDRYVGANANPFIMIAERALLSALIVFFATGYVFASYELPVNGTMLSLMATAFSALFSFVFTFIRKRIIIPAAALVGAVIALWHFKAFTEKLSYFADGILLECDGRIFETAESLFHRMWDIERGGEYLPKYVEGVMFGCVLMCLLFALLTSAGLGGKPRMLPSLIMFIIMLVPPIASEKLYFNWRLIPTAALYIGAATVCVYYRDGLAVRYTYAAGGYRKKLALDNRLFNGSLKTMPAAQRAASAGLRYSKYFSSVMSAGAVAAVLGIVFNIFFADSTGLDYTKFYEKIQNIGALFDSGDPFKKGTESAYFTSVISSAWNPGNRIQLLSPSSSTKEILRVQKNVGQRPLYLRGDVGITFNGVSWSSPVADKMPGKISDDNVFINGGLSASAMYDNGDVIRVSVEYLSDTDVVFAPAYDLLNTVHADLRFDVFGDSAARAKSGSLDGEKVEYTAYVPFYTDFDRSSDANDFLSVLRYSNYCDSYGYEIAGDYGEIIYTGSLSSSEFYDNCVANTAYLRYIDEHYLDVPLDLAPRLDEYIRKTDLEGYVKEYKEMLEYGFDDFGNPIDLDGGLNPVGRKMVDRFVRAAAVSDYLRENYAYSLDSSIDKRDPIMSFLNDEKSGHCALFASAMTLILREWGIPARYCTGFAANANLNVQTLRAKDLHAWCEVYLDNLGWITFDPTASAALGGNGIGQGVTSEPESSVASEPESKPESSEPQDASSGVVSEVVSAPGASDVSDSLKDGNSANFLPYVLTILAICAVIALIAVGIVAYHRLKTKAYKRIQSFNRYEDSEYVYTKLLAVLSRCRIEPRAGEQPHEFFERAERELECSLSESYALFERLAFGSAELDESERAVLGRAFDRVFRAAERKRALIGKILLRRLVLKSGKAEK